MDENDAEFMGCSGVKFFFDDLKYPDFKPEICDKYVAWCQSNQTTGAAWKARAGTATPY